MLSVAAPQRKNHHPTTPAETMFCLAVTDPYHGEDSHPVAVALSRVLGASAS
jgi:hypothetical protein